MSAFHVYPVPSSGLYEVCKRYTFISKDGASIQVPKGFQWDGASIPAALYTFAGVTPFHPTVMRASCIHDFLYDQEDNTQRKLADDLFLEIMLEDGVPEDNANKMYTAVRAFGNLFFDGDMSEEDNSHLYTGEDYPSE